MTKMKIWWHGSCCAVVMLLCIGIVCRCIRIAILVWCDDDWGVITDYWLLIIPSYLCCLTAQHLTSSLLTTPQTLVHYKNYKEWQHNTLLLAHCWLNYHPAAGGGGVPTTPCWLEIVHCPDLRPRYRSGWIVCAALTGRDGTVNSWNVNNVGVPAISATCKLHVECWVWKGPVSVSEPWNTGTWTSKKYESTSVHWRSESRLQLLKNLDNDVFIIPNCQTRTNTGNYQLWERGPRSTLVDAEIQSTTRQRIIMYCCGHPPSSQLCGNLPSYK